MLQHLQLHLKRTEILNLVDRIVARGQHAVWQRVRDRVASMSKPHARGYIRVRAALVIERELSIAIAQMDGLNDIQTQYVHELVRDELIERILSDAGRLSRATQPLGRAA